MDPLAAKYPSHSPYNYCANNPIIYYDPDGKVIKVAGKKVNRTQARDYMYKKMGEILRGESTYLNILGYTDTMEDMKDTIKERGVLSYIKDVFFPKDQEQGSDGSLINLGEQTTVTTESGKKMNFHEITVNSKTSYKDLIPGNSPLFGNNEVYGQTESGEDFVGLHFNLTNSHQNTQTSFTLYKTISGMNNFLAKFGMTLTKVKKGVYRLDPLKEDEKEEGKNE